MQRIADFPQHALLHAAHEFGPRDGEDMVVVRDTPLATEAAIPAAGILTLEERRDIKHRSTAILSLQRCTRGDDERDDVLLPRAIIQLECAARLVVDGAGEMGAKIVGDRIP